MTSLFPQSEQLPLVSEHWCLTRDGDEYGYALAQRHYSARRYLEPRQRLFVGPGRKLVLLGVDGQALFVWRQFKCDIQPPQVGYNCSIFRNEGTALSSLLIREAVGVVFLLWGRARCWTLVNPFKVRSSNPGCCFQRAGWKRCGVSKTGKIIFDFAAPLSPPCGDARDKPDRGLLLRSERDSLSSGPGEFKCLIPGAAMPGEQAA